MKENERGKKGCSTCREDLGLKLHTSATASIAEHRPPGVLYGICRGHGVRLRFVHKLIRDSFLVRPECNWYQLMNLKYCPFGKERLVSLSLCLSVSLSISGEWTILSSCPQSHPTALKEGCECQIRPQLQLGSRSTHSWCRLQTRHLLIFILMRREEKSKCRDIKNRSVTIALLVSVTNLCGRWVYSWLVDTFKHSQVNCCNVSQLLGNCMLASGEGIWNDCNMQTNKHVLKTGLFVRGTEKNVSNPGWSERRASCSARYCKKRPTTRNSFSIAVFCMNLLPWPVGPVARTWSSHTPHTHINYWVVPNYVCVVCSVCSVAWWYVCKCVICEVRLYLVNNLAPPHCSFSIEYSKLVCWVCETFVQGQPNVETLEHKLVCYELAHALSSSFWAKIIRSGKWKEKRRKDTYFLVRNEREVNGSLELLLLFYESPDSSNILYTNTLFHQKKKKW